LAIVCVHYLVWFTLGFSKFQKEASISRSYKEVTYSTSKTPSNPCEDSFIVSSKIPV
jgi:hypothetical protein